MLAGRRAEAFTVAHQLMHPIQSMTEAHPASRRQVPESEARSKGIAQVHSSSCECGYGCCLLRLPASAETAGAVCLCGCASLCVQCRLPWRSSLQPVEQGPARARRVAAARTHSSCSAHCPPSCLSCRQGAEVCGEASCRRPALAAPRPWQGGAACCTGAVPCCCALLCGAASARLVAPAPRVHSLCPAASFGAGACVPTRLHLKLALQLPAHSSHAHPSCCISPAAAAGRRVPGQHGHLCVQARGAV